jgi:hypothetical protein
MSQDSHGPVQQQAAEGAQACDCSPHPVEALVWGKLNHSKEQRLHSNSNSSGKSRSRSRQAAHAAGGLCQHMKVLVHKLHQHREALQQFAA